MIRVVKDKIEWGTTANKAIAKVYALEYLWDFNFHLVSICRVGMVNKAFCPGNLVADMFRQEVVSLLTLYTLGALVQFILYHTYYSGWRPSRSVADCKLSCTRYVTALAVYLENLIRQSYNNLCLVQSLTKWSTPVFGDHPGATYFLRSGRLMGRLIRALVPNYYTDKGLETNWRMLRYQRRYYSITKLS